MVGHVVHLGLSSHIGAIKTPGGQYRFAVDEFLEDQAAKEPAKT
jgi:hypothetical protein